MPDRPKARFQIKRNTGVYAVRRWSAHQTWLCRRTRDGVTPEEDPTFLKMAKLECATWKGLDIGPTACQARGKLSNEVPWT